MHTKTKTKHRAPTNNWEIHVCHVGICTCCDVRPWLELVEVNSVMKNTVNCPVSNLA